NPTVSTSGKPTSSPISSLSNINRQPNSDSKTSNLCILIFILSKEVTSILLLVIFLYFNFKKQKQHLLVLKVLFKLFVGAESRVPYFHKSLLYQHESLVFGGVLGGDSYYFK